MTELDELFDEFETDDLVVSDFDIQYRGCRVDHIIRDEKGELHYWGGNPTTDKFAEEFTPTREERKVINQLALENF